jgi:hypothetical protein
MFPMRPALVRRRPLLRAAAVGGGAFMAGRAAARRSAEHAGQEAAQDQRISDLEDAGQQAAPPPAPEPDVFSQLNKLVQLYDRGALTEEEFTAAKERLLG